METSVSIPETTQRSGLLFAGLCALNGAFVPAVEERERVPAQTAPLATPADPETGGDQA
jgi:hypothetical protein